MNAVHLSVSDRIRAYLGKIPGAESGNGGHDQTFSVACAVVHGFALSEHEAMPFMREYNQRCTPPWSEAELVHKLRSAAAATHMKPRGHLLGTNARIEPYAYSPRPSVGAVAKIDPATAVENYLKGNRAAEVELWEASPIRPTDDWTQDGCALVGALYQPDERINFVIEHTVDAKGKAVPCGKGEIVERNALIARWRSGMPASLAGGWLRMNPLDGAGVADANVTDFRFALVECDAVPLDLQLSLFAKLPLPIAAILTSGGRSLHAWVRVDADSVENYKATVARMLAILGKFGVDGKNKNPSRLSRLPGVIRTLGADGDGRQRLLYLNPSPKQQAIL